MHGRNFYFAHPYVVRLPMDVCIGSYLSIWGKRTLVGAPTPCLRDAYVCVACTERSTSVCRTPVPAVGQYGGQPVS